MDIITIFTINSYYTLKIVIIIENLFNRISDNKIR